MDYQELADKAILEIAQKICWDDIAYQQQEDYLNQAKEIWNRKILNLVSESVSETEKYYK